MFVVKSAVRPPGRPLSESIVVNRTFVPSVSSRVVMSSMRFGDLLGPLDTRADGRLVDDAELALVGVGEELGADQTEQAERRDEERR